MTGFRIVAVNHCHPQMPHVCALRVRSFAEALARKGHQVVLLTESLDRLDASPPPEALQRLLEAHDWTDPFVLACAPQPSPIVGRARIGGFPSLINKAVIGTAYGLYSGLFGDWVAATGPYWKELKTHFQPQTAWGTFGNTGAWLIARGIARECGCPWVMDIKDSWAYFIPGALRRPLARRFRDAVAVTALSHYYAAESEEWFGREATVVYSGIHPEFMHVEDRDGPWEPRRVTLVGSIYDGRGLEVLISGLRSWLEEGSEERRNDVSFAYFGLDVQAVKSAVVPLAGLCRVEVEGFRPLADMHEALRRSWVNIYARDVRGPFHHKLFELLSAGRPIICVPEEGNEAESIVADVGGVLHSCRTAADVDRALADAWDRRETAIPLNRKRLACYTWDSQAEILERVLTGAITEGSR